VPLAINLVCSRSRLIFPSLTFQRRTAQASLDRRGRAQLRSALALGQLDTRTRLSNSRVVLQVDQERVSGVGYLIGLLEAASSRSRPCAVYPSPARLLASLSTRLLSRRTMSSTRSSSSMTANRSTSDLPKTRRSSSSTWGFTVRSESANCARAACP
jgi:hypothetical protein